MKKSLYSLMLMDSVVREIDRIALQQNTNRSNLVNQILAEYVSMMTPEKRIDNIFRYIENVMNEREEIIPYVEPNNLTMSMKSSLEYKYRPTIRYEVQLYRVPEGDIGELSVIFRTQSSSLLRALHEFFILWKNLEDVYASSRRQAAPIHYRLENGRMVRSISATKDRDYSNEQLAQAISDYIVMLDALMKGYLSGRYGVEDIEERYVSYLSSAAVVI